MLTCGHGSAKPKIVQENIDTQQGFGWLDIWDAGRGTGKGALNHIQFVANNVAASASELSQSIPGLTAQHAIRHMIEHVMNHEFFHLIIESTIFRLAERLGKNPGRLSNKYKTNNREEGINGMKILRLEEAAANAFAFASHSIPLTAEQKTGFRDWLRMGGIGYGEFELCLEENGVTPHRIHAIMQLVFGIDVPEDAHDVYLEECTSLQPLFRNVSVLIDPVDPEETDYAPHVFKVGENRSIPHEFYPITLAWLEENLELAIQEFGVHNLQDYFKNLRNTKKQPAGEMNGSVIVHPVPDTPYIAMMMKDEENDGWLALELFHESKVGDYIIAKETSLQNGVFV